MLRAPTLPELLSLAARTEPRRPAFRYRSEVVSYEDWEALSLRLAGVLQERGVRRGDVVALLLPSTPLYQVAYLAAARLGAVTAGINARYRRKEIRQILQRAAPRAVIAVRSWHEADFTSSLEDPDPGMPGSERILWVDAEEVRRGTGAAVARLASDGTAVSSPGPAPSDPVAIVFTSGTTGLPKGAFYSHAAVLALAEIETRRYEGGQVPFRTHLAAGLSFAHIGTMGRIALQIAHLGTSIIHDGFDPAAVLETIERERLFHLGGIPTQVIMLLEHPDRPRRDLTSLGSVLLGGAPAAPDLIRRIRDELGVTVSVRYSSTEVGIATASLPADPVEVLVGTVGKATPGVELRIVDERNDAVATGSTGEVVVRSPACMTGYWNDPEATARVRDAEGWIHTGDLGFLDEDGYLHLRGRRSEMFIRGGYNVFPAEVEDRLALHPQVERVAVVGVPEPRFGEVGWAFVVPRSPADPPSLPELRAWVGTELASFKRPDGLTILERLPVTPMFKVDKLALRRRHEEASPARLASSRDSAN